MTVHEIMLSKGWEYSRCCLAYKRSESRIGEKFSAGYVKHHYPKEYKEMKSEDRLVKLETATANLITADEILGSKVADLGIAVREQGKRISSLEQKEFCSVNLSIPSKLDLDTRLEEAKDEVKKLRKKMRSVDAENESLKHQMYFNAGPGRTVQMLRRSASSYIKMCHAQIKELEHKLAEESRWCTKYKDSQVQNTSLKRRLVDLGKILAKADNCIVKQGDKSKERNEVIDQLRIRLGDTSYKLMQADDEIIRKTAKIASMEELCKRVLRYDIPSRLYYSIKEELQ
jgi:hypothetical protein